MYNGEENVKEMLAQRGVTMDMFEDDVYYSAYFTYRKNEKALISSSLRPLFGHYVDGDECIRYS